MIINIELLTASANTFLPPQEATLLNGIVFGTSLPSHSIVYNEMKRIGISHIAVFSGANIAIMLQSMSGIRAYIGTRLYSLIAILFIVFITFIVGIKAPVMRAAFFSLCTYVAILLRRKKSTLYILLVSLFILLAYKPYWIGSISFQLSYAATVALILFGKGNSSTKENPIVEYFSEEIRTSTAALIGTTPLIFYYFRQISLIAPLSNLAVSFTIPLLLPLGFFGSMVGIFSPNLSRPLYRDWETVSQSRYEPWPAHLLPKLRCHFA